MALFLITAPSGTGKTSIMEMVKQYLGNKALSECVSHTTRPMRENEVDGQAYYFISEEYFEYGVNEGEFAETVNYNGYWYGISIGEINKRMQETDDVYIIVNYDGYKQVKEVFPDAIGIFLHMSKEDCMANMLLRGDSIESAIERIELYDDEMKNRVDYDYVIKNVRDKQTHTRNIIAGIIYQN